MSQLKISIYDVMARGGLLVGVVVLAVLVVNLLQGQRTPGSAASLPEIPSADQDASADPSQVKDRFTAVDTERVVTTATTSTITSLTTLQPTSTVPTSGVEAPVIIDSTSITTHADTPVAVEPVVMLAETTTSVEPVVMFAETTTSVDSSPETYQMPTSTSGAQVCIPANTAEAKSEVRYRIVVGVGGTTMTIAGAESGPVSTAWTWRYPAESTSHKSQSEGRASVSVSVSTSDYEGNSNC